MQVSDPFVKMNLREINLEFVNEPIFQWLAQYAYQPGVVYLALIGMMLLSGFGLPLPEEVTIVSIGIISYMGYHPDLFPPPYPGAPVVDRYHAALIGFFAVFFSDLLVFVIGRSFGRKLIKSGKLKKWFSPAVMDRINSWTNKYGIYAAGIFRFTPGIRFPGHLACGISEFSIWKFCLVDGFAALISVPTQILLIAKYGEKILIIIHEFKMTVLIALISLVLFLILKKLWNILTFQRS